MHDNGLHLPLDHELFLQNHAEKLMECTVVPYCISNTLVRFKIENFGGEDDQLRLVKYIMDNAPNLKVLIISPSKLLLSSSDRDKEKIREKLLLFKTTSLNMNATVDFSALF